MQCQGKRKFSVFAQSERLLEVGGIDDSAKLADWGKMRALLRRSWGVDLPYNTKGQMESWKQRKDVTRSL